MLTFGETSLGTPVELNRTLKDYSLVIITGAVGFHYFAGFTGGRKSICPGLASVRTIEATHMLALDFETGGRRSGVDAGELSGNLVHEECDRIAAMIAPAFNITTEVDVDGRAIRLYAGDWRSSHEAACREYLLTHSRAIERQRQLVIVSCGGFPYDINLIQAHKALDMAARACCEGGTIVLVAECTDGLGRPDFLKWFSEKDSRALATRLRESYEVNGQTAWALLNKTESYRVHLVSQLPEDEVRLMRMVPARSLDEALSDVPDTDAFIMPRGAAVFPRVEPIAP
jgi:nickel-dependent lactate racemase